MVEDQFNFFLRSEVLLHLKICKHVEFAKPKLKLQNLKVMDTFLSPSEGQSGQFGGSSFYLTRAKAFIE